MRNSQRVEFQRLITDAMAFYGKDVSEFALSVWWQACETFDFEQVAKAFTAHAMDSDRGQFVPKPADIVRQLGGTKTDASLRAWSKLHSAMSDVGAYTDVAFDDAIIHRVVEDMGGWAKLCRLPIDDLSYVQHRFCESYRSFAGRDDFSYPRSLGGDRSNDGLWAKRGLEPPKPTLIGDKEKAMRVYMLKDRPQDVISSALKTALKIGP